MSTHRNVAVFGATSAIAQAVIRDLAASGAELFLAARSAERLGLVAADARVRGARRVETAVADLDDVSGFPSLVEGMFDVLGRIDLVLVAQGVLADSEACEREPALTPRLLHGDFVAPATLCERVGLELARRQRSGVVAAIGSVAGDRGRQSNYAYGAAKGGLALFLQGLRNRLHGRGVHVLTVKPGFVATPMTAHLRRNALFVEPEVVARALLHAAASRRDVIYVPGFWRAILWFIRAVPEAIFKRLSL